MRLPYTPSPFAPILSCLYKSPKGGFYSRLHEVIVMYLYLYVYESSGRAHVASGRRGATIARITGRPGQWCLPTYLDRRSPIGSAPRRRVD